MPDTEAAGPAPFWTIEVTLKSEAEFKMVYTAIEKILHDVGEIGFLAGQKWQLVGHEAAVKEMPDG